MVQSAECCSPRTPKNWQGHAVKGQDTSRLLRIVQLVDRSCQEPLSRTFDTDRLSPHPHTLSLCEASDELCYPSAAQRCAPPTYCQSHSPDSLTPELHQLAPRSAIPPWPCTLPIFFLSLSYAVMRPHRPIRSPANLRCCCASCGLATRVQLTGPGVAHTSMAMHQPPS